MLQSLIDFVCRGPEEDVFSLPLEDVAVALAWYQSLEAHDERRGTYEAPIRRRVAAWQAEHSPPVTVTAGRRQQPLLRAILDHLQRAGVQDVHPAKLDVVMAARQLVEGMRDPDTAGRLPELLEAHAPGNTVAAKRKTLPATPGLAGLEQAIVHVTANDLLKAAARNVSTFGGLALTKRGPLITHKAPVRVLDSVPDDTLLVVEGHGCWINGYVLGHVACTGSCEVRENIAGLVIARRGEIRARNLITNAYVVVKAGNVAVRTAENPKLVFAGESIHILDKAIGGCFTANTVDVKGDVTGGEYNVARAMTARRFRQSDTRRLAVVLRRYISAEDYGELIGPEASQVIARLARLRQRRNHVQDLKRLAESEIEHFASSGIMYILGGEQLRLKIEELNKAQRRMAFLDRVIAGIDALSVSTEEQLLTHTRGTGYAAAAESVSPLEDFETDFDDGGEEDAPDDDLKAEQQELREIGRQLATETGQRNLPPSALFRLRERKVNWMLERDTLAEKINRIEQEIRKAVGKGDLLEKADSEQGKAQILSRLIAAAQKRPLTDPLGERVSAPFTRLMRRSVESRQKRVSHYERTLSQLSDEYTQHTEKLEEEFRLASPLQERRVEDVDVRVHGCFDAGVTLALEHYLLETKAPPEGTLIRTADTGDTPTTYRRIGDTIIHGEGDPVNKG